VIKIKAAAEKGEKERVRRASYAPTSSEGGAGEITAVEVPTNGALGGATLDNPTMENIDRLEALVKEVRAGRSHDAAEQDMLDQLTHVLKNFKALRDSTCHLPTDMSSAVPGEKLKRLRPLPKPGNLFGASGSEAGSFSRRRIFPAPLPRGVADACETRLCSTGLQENLAHKKPPPPLGEVSRSLSTSVPTTHTLTHTQPLVPTTHTHSLDDSPLAEDAKNQVAIGEKGGIEAVVRAGEVHAAGIGGQAGAFGGGRDFEAVESAEGLGGGQVPPLSEIYQANGSNAKSMAPTFAESSEGEGEQDEAEDAAVTVKLSTLNPEPYLSHLTLPYPTLPYPTPYTLHPKP